MAPRKPSGRLSRGPWEYSGIRRALEAAGWATDRQKGSHVSFKHPTRTGTIQIDTNWSGVKVGSYPFRGICDQGGYTKKELQMLLDRYA